MNRAEHRRKAGELKKRVKNMSTAEFDKILQESIGGALETGHYEGFRHCMMAVEKALRKEFGFGDKRIDRLVETIGEIAEETKDGICD